MLTTKLEKKVNKDGKEYYFCARCYCATLVQSRNKCKVFDAKGFKGDYIMFNLQNDLDQGSCPICDRWEEYD